MKIQTAWWTIAYENRSWGKRFFLQGRPGAGFISQVVIQDVASWSWEEGLKGTCSAQFRLSPEFNSNILSSEGWGNSNIHTESIYHLILQKL